MGCGDCPLETPNIRTQMALFLRPRRAKTRAEPINREHRSQALLSGPDSSQLKEEFRLEAAGDPARGRVGPVTLRSWWHARPWRRQGAGRPTSGSFLLSHLSSSTKGTH